MSTHHRLGAPRGRGLTVSCVDHQWWGMSTHSRSGHAWRAHRVHTWRLMYEWGISRRRASGEVRPVPKVSCDVREHVLYDGLRLADFCNVGLKTTDPPTSPLARGSYRAMRRAYSKPASPVRLASRVGFSNTHSKPACRHRLQGGFSAPSQRIFCLRHAFCGAFGLE